MDWGYILCVDDDSQELNTLANQLQEEFSRSHIVYKAVSVEEAVVLMDMLQASNKPIELILCKHRMPGIQGADFLDDVQKANPDIMKVLLLDEADTLSSEYLLSRATIHNFLERPWKREHLLLTVEALLKLYNVTQRIENVQEIGLQFGPIFDLPELLHRTVDSIEAITAASKIAIAITNGENRDIHMIISNASKEGKNETFQESIPEGLQRFVGEAFAQRREPLVFSHVAENQYLQRIGIPEWYQTRHLVCIPLWRKDRFFGVIFVADKRSGLLFLREDILLVKIIAFQLLASLENIRLTEEKLRIERVSTIGNMASEIIHDLKGPMTTIMGFAELLERDDCTLQEQQDYSRMIGSEVEDMVTMVEEILEFSRGSKMTLNLSSCNLEQLVAEVCDMLEQNVFKEQRIRLITKLQCTRRLYADKEKLKRVFYNIARNAAEAMRDYGRFSINTYLHHATHVEFRLADSGPGIPPHVKHNIFEPFMTYGKKRGTGLGMSIARKIITEHGGDIWVESEEGKGTIFYFTVPVMREK
jgi:signal transduction histidine kinase/DNA-binding response OmpR family regulator